MFVILTASCKLLGVVGFLSLFLESFVCSLDVCSVSFPSMLLQWQNVSTENV